MSRTGLLRLALALSILLSGCASPVPEQPSGGAPGLYPTDFRTQNPKVDAVIDAYMSKDVDRLMGLVWMREGKCGEDPEFFCGDKPNGTVRSYFSWASCSSNFLTDTESIREQMVRWVAEPRYLYAAYRVQGMDPNAYYVMFASALDDHSSQNAYLNADGKITHQGMGCNVPVPMPADRYQPIAPPTKP